MTSSSSETPDITAFDFLKKGLNVALDGELYKFTAKATESECSLDFLHQKFYLKENGLLEEAEDKFQKNNEGILIKKYFEKLRVMVDVPKTYDDSLSAIWSEVMAYLTTVNSPLSEAEEKYNKLLANRTIEPGKKFNPDFKIFNGNFLCYDGVAWQLTESSSTPETDEESELEALFEELIKPNVILTKNNKKYILSEPVRIDDFINENARKGLEERIDLNLNETKITKLELSKQDIPSNFETDKCFGFGNPNVCKVGYQKVEDTDFPNEKYFYAYIELSDYDFVGPGGKTIHQNGCKIAVPLRFSKFKNSFELRPRYGRNFPNDKPGTGYPVLVIGNPYPHMYTGFLSDGSSDGILWGYEQPICIAKIETILAKPTIGSCVHELLRQGCHVLQNLNPDASPRSRFEMVIDDLKKIEEMKNKAEFDKIKKEKFEAVKSIVKK